MGSLTLSRFDHTHLDREFDRGLIAALRDQVLGAEAEVDTIRSEIDAAVERLHWTVARRNDLARQLAEAIGRAA